MRRKYSAATPQVAFRNICIIMGLGTLAVAAASNLLYIDLCASKTLAHSLEAVGTGGLLWLIVCSGWYWILSNRPQVESPTAQKQTEGVWPPAPIIVAEEDNKD